MSKNNDLDNVIATLKASENVKHVEATALSGLLVRLVDGTEITCYAEGPEGSYLEVNVKATVKRTARLP